MIVAESAPTVSYLSTLIVDDVDSFRSYLAELRSSVAERNAPVAFAGSVREAKERLRKTEFQRVVSDLIFDQESEDGVALLEFARAKAGVGDLILLTGKPVDPEHERRLSDLGARTIRKGDLNFDLARQILEGQPQLPPTRLHGPETDLGELKLRYDALLRHKHDVEELNSVLVEDILHELGKLPNQTKRTMFVGDRFLSMEELRREVVNRTEIGLELIRLHHQLNSRLRESRK